ncbi:hypothetical protein THAOC_32451, partial [Thalassiosira oceanica]
METAGGSFARRCDIVYAGARPRRRPASLDRHRDPEDEQTAAAAAARHRDPEDKQWNECDWFCKQESGEEETEKSLQDRN